MSTRPRTLLERQVEELDAAVADRYGENPVRIPGFTGSVVVYAAMSEGHHSLRAASADKSTTVDSPALTHIVATGDPECAYVYGVVDAGQSTLGAADQLPCVRLRTPQLEFLSRVCGLRQTWGV